MPTPYHLALLFVRMAAAMGITVGLFGVGSTILVMAVSMAVGGGWGDFISSLASPLMSYGMFYLVIGIVELIFAKRIARFAAKAMES